MWTNKGKLGEGEGEEDRKPLCLYEQGRVCDIHYLWWHLCDTRPLSWYGRVLGTRFTQRVAHIHSFTDVQAFAGHFHENMLQLLWYILTLPLQSLFRIQTESILNNVWAFTFYIYLLFFYHYHCYNLLSWQTNYKHVYIAFNACKWQVCLPIFFIGKIFEIFIRV